MAEAEEEKKEKKEKKKEKEKEKEGEDEAPASKKGKLGGLLKKKKLLIIIAAVVVLGGAGAFFFLKGSPEPVLDEAEAGQVEQTADVKEKDKSKRKATDSDDAGGAEVTSNVKLEPFIVNLVDNSGTRYLKVTLNLELASERTASRIESQNARIRDSVIVLLSSKSYAEIGSVEGKYQLRDEIVQRINQFIGGDGVKTAYFTEFVIQ